MQRYHHNIIVLIKQIFDTALVMTNKFQSKIKRNFFWPLSSKRESWLKFPLPPQYIWGVFNPIWLGLRKFLMCWIADVLSIFLFVHLSVCIFICQCFICLCLVCLLSISISFVKCFRLLWTLSIDQFVLVLIYEKRCQRRLFGPIIFYCPAKLNRFIDN